MSISSHFPTARKRLAMGITSLSLAFLAACGQPAAKLGDAAETPDLRGSTVTETVFAGGTADRHTTIDATALKSGQHYAITGTLTINGDLPEKTKLDVINGTLTINGDVGAHSRLNVQLPIVTHSETHIMPMTIVSSCGRNCMTTRVTMIPVTSTVIDGLRYPRDPHPAVTITGNVHDDVRITSNGHTVAGGWNNTIEVYADHGASRAQVSIAQLRAPGS